MGNVMTTLMTLLMLAALAYVVYRLVKRNRARKQEAQASRQFGAAGSRDLGDIDGI